MRLVSSFLISLAAIMQFATTAFAATIEDVTRGLEAQYQANLIRERRLADDREQRLLRDAEARVQRARAQADARAAGAENELHAAREAYAALAASLIARDEEAQNLSEAYAMQLERDLLQATPLQLEALQRFADGDQRAGFEQYRAESARRSAARRRVADQATIAADMGDVAEARQQALMGDVMTSSGRASVAEALELWDTVARLSPGDSYAHARRSHLALQVNDLARAQSAAQAAFESAQNDDERYGALYSLRSIASLRNDTAGASRYSQSALHLARQIHARAPQSIRLSLSLSTAAEDLFAQGNVADARRLYEEALETARERLRAFPHDLNSDLDIVAATWGLSRIQAQDGDPEAALRVLGGASDSVDRLMGPNRTVDTYSMGVGVLTYAGNLALRAGNYTAARDAHQRSADLARAAADVDPANVGFARAHSAALTALGDDYRQLEDLGRARALYRESLAIDQRLYEGDPNNVIRVTDYWVSLWRVARYGGERWSRVVEVMEDAQRRGLLPAEHAQALSHARRFAREQRR